MNRVLICCVIASLFSVTGCTVHEKETVHEKPVIIAPEREKTVVVPAERPRDRDNKTEINIENK